MTTQRERLVAGYGGRMLASLAVAWAILQLGRFLLSPLLPAITADLGMTNATAGLVLGAFQGIYALTQYPSGRLSDTYTRVSLVIPGLVMLTLSFLLFAAATSVVVFAVAALALGIGKGLFTVPSRATLSELFVERRGQALGVYMAGTDVGGILASGIAVVVTGGLVTGIAGVDGVLTVGDQLDWRAPFVPIALTLASISVVYAHWNRNPYELGRTDIELVATVRRLATTRAQREALVAFALFYFVVGAWINFLPTYLAAGKGIEETVAAALFAVVFVVGVAAKPLAGLLSDRLPRRLVAVAGLLVAVAALVGVVLADSMIVIVAVIALFAVGYKAQFPIADAILLDAAPDVNVGGDLGAARALFLGVGALGPVYMGAVSTAAGYRVAFVGLGGCLLVAAGLLFRGR